jgi:hypothetical protein
MGEAMSNAPRSGDTSVKWTEKTGVVLAAVAILVSAISLSRSCQANSLASSSNSIAKTANALGQEANTIAGAGQATSAAQAAIALRATLVANTFIARHPDLRSAADEEWWGPLNMAPSIIPTQYWHEQRATYTEQSALGYYFLLFLNNGPGGVTAARFTEFQWESTPSASPPQGVAPPPALDPLRPLQFYALLVDVLQPTAQFSQWSTTNFNTNDRHFQWIRATLEYDDAVTSGISLEVLLGESPLWRLPTPGPLPNWPR